METRHLPALCLLLLVMILAFSMGIKSIVRTYLYQGVGVQIGVLPFVQVQS